MQKVLIVDDNTTLAYFTARNLERDIKDLKVLTAASCVDAWKQAEENSFSAMIVDLNLSDGNGIDLVNQVLERFPDISAILISGEMPRGELRPNLFGFLLKPYEAPSLSELVRSAIAKETRKLPEPVHRSTDENRAEECEGYNSHHVRNQLSTLLVGLRSFGADLVENAYDPETVKRTVDEYLDTLCSYVHEVTKELPVCKGTGKDKTS
ncbi:MAG: response regulator [Desulfomonile tiedjei]|uniref:Response regulator n=1 Tax=Desulfomonile tiedjei TaxID=2358 RepID=A0A9D6Z630_9BACT|nr:response regulator [Desulfomonile tiedjei]